MSSITHSPPIQSFDTPLIFRWREDAHPNIAIQQSGSLVGWHRTTDSLAKNGPRTIIHEESSHITEKEVPCLHETLGEIQKLAELEDNWNDENSPVIDRNAILRADKFVASLSRCVTEQSLMGDCAPTVFPTIEGGVMLYWKGQNRQIALTFQPHKKGVDVVQKSLGETVTRQSVSENEAGEVALEAMRKAV